MPRTNTPQQLEKINGLKEALKAIDYLLTNPSKELDALTTNRAAFKQQRVLLLTELIEAVEEFTDIRP